MRQAWDWPLNNNRMRRLRAAQGSGMPEYIELMPPMNRGLELRGSPASDGIAAATINVAIARPAVAAMTAGG